MKKGVGTPVGVPGPGGLGPGGGPSKPRLRIIDTPFVKEVVTRRRVAGKDDDDNSTIVAEMVDDVLVRLSYDDPTTGFSSFTFPISKVADVMAVLSTVEPPAVPATTPADPVGPAPAEQPPTSSPA